MFSLLEGKDPYGMERLPAAWPVCEDLGRGTPSILFRKSLCRIPCTVSCLLLFVDIRNINGKRRRGATSFPVSLRAIKDVEGLQVPDEEEEQPRAQFIFGVRSS